MKALFNYCFLLVALIISTALLGQEQTGLHEITILYTDSAHGWVEGMSPDQGASNLYQLRQEQEGCSEDGPFLVLSGGNNWTGPGKSG